MILVHYKETVAQVPLNKLQEKTGAVYLPHLEFDSFSTLRKMVKKSARLEEKKAFSKRQIWLGTYFSQEILNYFTAEVSLRWINDSMGWGIFAEKDLPEMQFIAEYTGIFRKRRRKDKKNAYCFECPLIRGEESDYLIDAQDKGGIARYVNHSQTPNLASALATVLDLPHVILFTTKKVKKGDELCYDYGSDYWKRRKQR